MPPKRDAPNQNTPEYLDNLRIRILEHLSHINPAPSVAFHERAPDAATAEEDEESMEPAGGRPGMRMWNGELDPEGDSEERPGGSGGWGVRADVSYADADAEAVSPTKQRLGSGGGVKSPRPNMLRASQRDSQGEPGSQ